MITHDIILSIKAIFLVSLVWLTDLLILQFAGFVFVSPAVREFLIEIKDVVSIMVSIVIFIATIYKIRNERRKK